MFFHSEVLFRNGIPQGDVRAASYGHTLGGSVGLVMLEPPGGQIVTKKFIERGNWEVQVAGKKFPAKISISALYDNKNRRIKLFN